VLFRSRKQVAGVAGIRRDISFHTGRHTFATLFLRRTKAANGILILQKILGHSDLGSTIIYSHVIGTDHRSLHSCTKSSVSGISLPVFANNTTTSSGSVPPYACRMRQSM
jgi:site-specific recombinase XerD